jgi:hypothetical protein
MRYTIATLIAFILLAGCRQSTYVSHIEQKTDVNDVKQKLDEFNDVDSLVTWLKEQTGVTDVSVNKRLLTTSNPPQVLVSYKYNGVKKSLLLYVEPENKLKLVKPGQRKIP